MHEALSRAAAPSAEGEPCWRRERPADIPEVVAPHPLRSALLTNGAAARRDSALRSEVHPDQPVDILEAVEKPWHHNLAGPSLLGQLANRRRHGAVAGGSILGQHRDKTKLAGAAGPDDLLAARRLSRNNECRLVE